MMRQNQANYFTKVPRIFSRGIAARGKCLRCAPLALRRLILDNGPFGEFWANTARAISPKLCERHVFCKTFEMSVWLYGGPENGPKDTTHDNSMSRHPATRSYPIAIRARGRDSPFSAPQHAHVICNFVLSCDWASKEVCLAPDGVQMAT